MQPSPEQLRAAPLFAALTDEELALISEWTEVRGAEAGDRVLPQGASGYAFFVIDRGTAEVVRDGEVVATLGPGNFFGEIAMLDGGRRIADVVATSPMQLLFMFGTAFREMEGRMRDVANRIRVAMQERLGGS